MSILSNVSSWASDAKDKVSSAVSNATSSIGSWLNNTYNNESTASIISAPSKSSTSTATNAGYNASENTNSATNSVYNTANDTSKISNLYDSTKTTTKTPTQYSSLKAYESDAAKTTTIENIQKSLNTLGYTYGDEGELKIDGDFGVKTQTNWDNFISDLGVTNYLSGIGNTSKSVSDFLVNNKSFNNYPNTNESTISAPTGNEYIFYGDPITEFKKNVLGFDENNKESSNNDLDLVDYINELIASGSAGLDASKIFNQDNSLLNKNTSKSIAKAGTTAISRLMTAIDLYEMAESFRNGDIENGLVSLGEVTGGSAGAVLGAGAAGAGSAGLAAAVGGAMGAVAGSELGGKAGRWIYDSGKWIYEQFN